MRSRWLWMLLALLWTATPALAQTTGTLLVLVVQGGEETPVEGVEVRLEGEDLIGGWQVRGADEQGGCVFDGLPPGTYQLQAREEGFDTVVVRNIVVDLGRQGSLTVVLEAGSVERTRIVEWQRTPPVEVEGGSGVVLTREFLERIPKNPGHSSNLQPVFPPTVSAGRGWSGEAEDPTFADCQATLQAGRLPSHNDVARLIDALRYDYPPAPAGPVPFVVHSEAWRLPDDPGLVWLRVGLQGQELEPVPLHLTFLVDLSSSDARRALRLAQSGRAPTDRALEVPFDRDHLLERVRQAHRIATGGYSADADNRVILLFGPDPGIDPTTLQALRDEVDTWAGTGITLSTVVFDEHLDLGLMDLARHGRGDHAFVDSPRERRRLFGPALAGSVTLARDLEVQVELDPSIQPTEGSWQRFTVPSVHLDHGRVASGTQVTRLFALRLPPEPGPVLATVRVRTRPPGADAPAAEHVTVLHTAALLDGGDTPSRASQLAFATYAFADRLGRRQLARHTWEEVVAMTQAAVDPSLEQEAAFLQMVERAAALAR